MIVLWANYIQSITFSNFIKYAQYKVSNLVTDKSIFMYKCILVLYHPLVATSHDTAADYEPVIYQQSFTSYERVLLIPIMIPTSRTSDNLSSKKYICTINKGPKCKKAGPFLFLKEQHECFQMLNIFVNFVDLRNNRQ